MVLLCYELLFHFPEKLAKYGGNRVNHYFVEALKLCRKTLMTAAFESIESLDEQGVLFSRDVLENLLQVCTQKNDLAATRRVHFLLIRSRLDLNGFLGDHLIHLFALCGSLLEAKLVFYRILNPNVKIWNAIIQAHVRLGEEEKAFDLYYRMRREGIDCDRHTFLCILKPCRNAGTLGQGRSIHDHAIRIGLESDMLVSSALVNMYGKCGRIEEAHKVFDKLDCDVVSWGAMIGGYAQHGQGLAAFDLFGEMQCQGLKPNKVIFLCVLKACGSIGALVQGQLIHEQIIRSGLESDKVVANTIVDMYSKNGSVDDAFRIFDNLVNRDVVSWGAMICGYVQNGYSVHAIILHEKMQQEGIKPNKAVFLCALKACRSKNLVRQGRLIHDQIIRDGIHSDVVIGSTLVDMYAKCGSLDEAHKVFDQLQCRDLIAWGALITGYAQHGHGLRALDLFSKMRQGGIAPDMAIMVSILTACASAGAIHQGRLIHEQIIKRELTSEKEICSCSLVNLYVKCGIVRDAQKVFSYLASPGVMAWGAMIGGYAECGHDLLALELFQKMQDEGVKADKVIFLSILRVIGGIGATYEGRWIHRKIFSHGLELDVVIGSGLINMYVKCGSLEEACTVFDELPSQNLVSWGAMMAGCCEHGNDLFALELFDTMQKEGLKPDRAVFLSTLKACANLGASAQGRLKHDQVIRSGLKLDDVITNALIDMYAKCGSLVEADEVFRKLSDPDVVSWGTLIAGYAMYGNCTAVGQCLEDLLIQKLKPDDVIFTGILTACSHAGLLHPGLQHFRTIIEDQGITPIKEHFNCVVDLLSRAGYLKEAEHILQTMPIQSSLRGWVSLLTGCKTYSDLDLGEKCFDNCLQFDQDNASGYMLMSSIYGNSYMWEDATGLQDLRKRAGVPKKPGMAWIEVDCKVHEFIVGSEICSQDDDIYSKLKRLYSFMKQLGYVAKLG